jgi:hypothetical protein
MEVLSLIGEYVLIGFFILLLISIINGVIHVTLMSTNLYDRLLITLRIPIQKKYQGKTSPIYEFKENSFDTNYSVRKWELKYTRSELSFLILLLIPYPIEILRYKYVYVGAYNVCERNEVHKYTQEDIIRIYEEKYQIDVEEHKKYVEETKKREEHLTQINKTFNQNYI